MTRTQARRTASYRAHLRWLRGGVLPGMNWLRTMVNRGKLKPIRIRGYDQDQHKWPRVALVLGPTKLYGLPLEMVRW